MLGTWIFDNDRFDLDGAVKTKTAGGFGSETSKATTKKESFTGCEWNRQL
jgi:hypothetical protein